MRTTYHALRRLSSLTLAVAVIAVTLPFSALAQVPGTKLILKPHCVLQAKSACGQFVVADAEHLRTPALSAGHILDIDVVLTTDKPKDVRSVRSWLKYDPASLEARSIEIMQSVLPQAIPGESTIDDRSGIIKIGAGTQNGIGSGETVVARVTFRVISVQAASEISFVDFRPDGSGTTSVASQSAEMLKSEPSKLTVNVLQPAGSTVSSSSSSAGSQTTGGSSTTGRNSAFTLLQVQNVRVTTRDNNIYLGWQALPSTDLAGYNVYYGTISGKYSQRRSIASANNSLIIRDLEAGTQYYLAVRAFNNASEETVFSHEVGVIVGKPETSTAPLAEATESQPVSPVDGNPIETRGGQEVTGETGVADSIAVLLLISACIGTVLAWRRQILVTPLSTHD